MSAHSERSEAEVGVLDNDQDHGGASIEQPSLDEKDNPRRVRRGSLQPNSKVSNLASSTQGSQSIQRKSSVRMFTSGSGRAGMVRRGSVRLLSSDLKRLMIPQTGEAASLTN